MNKMPMFHIRNLNVRESLRQSGLIPRRFSWGRGNKGFTLLLATLVASIVLALGASLFGIAQKEFILSSIGRDSQFAFYAADTGAECALYWDIQHEAFGSPQSGGEGESVTSGPHNVYNLSASQSPGTPLYLLVEDMETNGGVIPNSVGTPYNNGATRARMCIALTGSSNAEVSDYTTGSYSSPGDNYIYKWEGTQWTRYGARGNNSFTRTITCEVPGEPDVGTGSSADIECDGASISPAGFSPSYPYTMTFEYEPNGFCADVSVDKSIGPTGAVQTAIRADGFSTGCSLIATNPRTLQRSVELAY